MDEVERKSVMLDVLYEDKDVLVVVKPAGIESQTSRRPEPDMVSEIKKLSPPEGAGSEKVIHRFIPKSIHSHGGAVCWVIHRLDKPVRGVMVYAKNQKAAAHLSRQVQDGKLEKIYQAVVCGKPVDNVGKYVDYLLKDGKTNTSRIVDKSAAGAKRAELEYQILEEKEQGDGAVRSLVEIHLHTGRHHQIRVQFAAHGTPLVGDTKYGAPAAASVGRARREPLALCAVRLSFLHPVTGERMEFSTEPQFTL